MGGVLVDLDIEDCKNAFKSLLGYDKIDELIDPCHQKGIYGDLEEGTLSAEDFSADGLGIIDALCKASLCPSRGEARRLIQQGGVSVDDVKITDPMYIIPLSDFEKGYVIIKKGKKVFHKIVK